MIKVISFDIGGTLVKKAKRENARDEMMKMAGVSSPLFAHAYREHFIQKKNSLKDFCDKIGFSDIDKMEQFLRQYYASAPLGNLYDDVLSTLDELVKKGYLLISISNKSYMNHYGLKEYGLTSYFTREIYSYEVNSAKPETEIFKYAQRKMRVMNDEIIHIGDSWTSDIEGAHRAGWKSVLIVREKKNIPMSKVECTISNLNELLVML